jgi:hypothetical protein
MKDHITRCEHCGQRLIPFPGADGRTQLKCMWCDMLDPMEADRRADAPRSLDLARGRTEPIEPT